MKRIISIFLLLIMLVVGVHPVLAMHFCHGNLFSVSLINDRPKDKSCCCATKENKQDKVEPNDNVLPAFSDVHKSCCEFQQVELSTDDYDYNHQVQQFDLSKISPAFDQVWLVLNYSINRINPDESIIIQHYFPPGGLNKSTIDLLTYICIYRI